MWRRGADAGGVFEDRGGDALLADYAYLASSIRLALEQQRAPALAHCMGCTQRLSCGEQNNAPDHCADSRPAQSPDRSRHLENNRCVFDRTPPHA